MEHLSSDLLLYILDFLSLRTITSLCRTSKALHRLCTPRLYQNVNLAYTRSPFKAQEAFAYSLARYPDIADRVKKLNWSLWTNYSASSSAGRKYTCRILVLHQALACLKSLESFRLHGASRPRTCVGKYYLNRTGPLIRNCGEPFPLTVRSISLNGKLTDELLTPIVQHFSSSNVTTIELKDIQWDSELLTYPLPLLWSIREIPLQTLTIEHTILRDVPGPNPDYTLWIPLIASLRPEILVLRHAAAKKRLRRPKESSFRYDSEAPLISIEEQERALQLADDNLLQTFIPTLVTFYETDHFPRRIKLSNITPRVYASLQRVGMDVITVDNTR
jgi:hypothetical protein